MRFVFRGDEIAKQIEEATKLAINQTLAACVLLAKTDHPWQNVTGTAEGSIQMREAEVLADGKIRGTWGSFGVLYFIFLELGTSRMAALPALRPAADKEYSGLAARIRRNLSW